MFLTNVWYVAAWSHDLRAGEVKGLQIINESIALYRKTNGEVVALADRCPHRFAALSLGRVEGDDLRCMYHGMKFGPDGKCLHIPCQEMIPSPARLKLYPVVEKYSWIWVWMGEPSAADVELIPDATGLEHPDWSLKPGQMDYAAHHMLICDNLLDFTHLSYVHPSSFGVTAAWAMAKPEVLRRERAIHVQRWVADQPPPSQQQELGRIDYWNEYDFVLPGILLMTERIYRTGAAAASEFTAPSQQLEMLSASFTMQAVTPMTDKASRYFFAWGPRRVEDIGGLQEAFYEVAKQAFAEDRKVIEAQQRVIDLHPEERMMKLASDRGLQLFRQLWNEMLHSERSHETSQARPSPAGAVSEKA